MTDRLCTCLQGRIGNQVCIQMQSRAIAISVDKIKQGQIIEDTSKAPKEKGYVLPLAAASFSSSKSSSSPNFRRSSLKPNIFQVQQILLIPHYHLIFLVLGNIQFLQFFQQERTFKNVNFNFTTSSFLSSSSKSVDISMFVLIT